MNTTAKKPIVSFADLEQAGDFDITGDEPVELAEGANTDTDNLVRNISAGTEKSTTADEKGTFACERCQSSGTVQFYIRGGGYGQRPQSKKCPDCHGRGFFKSSKQDRMKNRAATAARKARVKEEREAKWAAANLIREQAFRAENVTVASWLDAESAAGNSFAQSLSEALTKWGSLSPGQLAAVERSIKERAARTDAPVVSLSRILEALTHAHTVGKLKWPKLRLLTKAGQKVVLGLAGSGAAKPGSINLTDGGPYGANTFFGRILLDGNLQPSRAITDDVTTLLVEVNKDPVGAAVVQGERSREIEGLKYGNCCCCGRELTDPVSVDRGIGPICFGKWGF